MHKLVLLSLMAATSAAVMAQTNPCLAPAVTLPWNAQTANGYVYYTAYGQSATQVAPFLQSVSLLQDINVNGTVVLTGFDVGYLFNDGSNGPNLASPPTLCTVNIWQCSGTWTGNDLTWPGVWSQLGQATCLYQGPWYATNHFTCTSPITLNSGLQGIALEFVAIQGLSCTQYNNVTTPNTPWEPMVFPSPTTPLKQDAFLTCNNFGWQINSFNTASRTSLTVTQPPAGTYLVDFPGFALYYVPVGGAAYYTSFGTGCVNWTKSFAERFSLQDPSNPQTFDLANSTISFVPSGNQYLVSAIPGAPSWYTPISTNLNVAGTTNSSYDDGLYPAQTLPFNFPVGWQGTTNSVQPGTNGILMLQNSARTGGFYDGLSAWVGDVASLCPFYGDLDESDYSGLGTWGGPPGSPNTYGVWFDIDPSGQQAYITWYTQEWLTYNTTNTWNFQVMLDSSGYIEFRYRSCTQEPNNANSSPGIVGFTPGHGVNSPGYIDIDALGSFMTGDANDAISATIAMSSRPILGTTAGIVTSNVNPTCLFGATLLGFGYLDPGIPIPGMPTCNLYLAGFLTNAYVNVGTAFAPVGSFTANVNIPNNPILNGLVLVSQSVQAVAPTANPYPGATLPFLSSPGLCVGLGVN